MGKISITTALLDILKSLNQPVITDYQLGVFIFNLYQEGLYEDQVVNKKITLPGMNEFHRATKTLLDQGILSDFVKIPSTYSIFGKNISDEEEVVCSVDPFSYISHLSAMEFHGLTDRISRTIIYSSPAPNDWRMAAKIKMAKDFKNNSVNMPSLTLKQIRKFGKKNINRVSNKHLGAYINIHDKMLRVSSIGRTFLDMLRRPDLCGGIHNCLDVFQQHGSQYLKLIIDEITQHGNSIEKVRAGYILEEYCNIKNHVLDNALEEWVKHAQRGGSRKLDPNNEYWPVFSEKWCLSINTEL